MSNSFHRNSCTEVYYQTNLQSTQTNILLELLVQIISEPCFTVLRTKEQLGYMVFSGIRRSNGVQGLRVIVQSDKHPCFVDQRIEAFLLYMRDYIENLSDAEFESHREALAAQRLEKPKRLSHQSSKYWAEISNQQYNFNRAEIEVAYLRTVSKRDLLDFYEDYIHHSGPHRHKLAVHVLSQVEGGAGLEAAPDPEALSETVDGLTKPPPYVPPTKIDDVTKFKSSHGLFPLVQPFISINTKSKL